MTRVINDKWPFVEGKLGLTQPIWGLRSTCRRGPGGHARQEGDSAWMGLVAGLLRTHRLLFGCGRCCRLHLPQDEGLLELLEAVADIFPTDRFVFLEGSARLGDVSCRVASSPHLEGCY